MTSPIEQKEKELYFWVKYQNDIINGNVLIKREAFDKAIEEAILYGQKIKADEVKKYHDGYLS